MMRGRCLCRLRDLLRALDLRFPDAQLEASYKSTQETEILRFMRIATISQVVIVAFMIITQIYSETYQARPGKEFQWAGDDPRTTTISIWIFSTIFCGAYTIFANLRMSRGWFMVVDVEMLSLLVLVMGTLVVHLANYWATPRFFGDDPDVVWNFESAKGDVNYVLVLDAILTCACLLSPIRTCFLWVLCFFMCMPYIVLSVMFITLDQHKLTDAILVVNLSMFAYVGAWRHEKSLRRTFLDLHSSDAKLKQSEERLQNERLRRSKAERRVLSSMCDAIVHLDSEHKLASPCPKLAGLLLRHGSVSTGEGASFVDHLAEGERERFEEFLRKEAQLVQEQTVEDAEGDDDIGHVYHSSLRDVNGTRVPVHLHCSCFVDHDDNVRHTIGVVEVGSEERTVDAPLRGRMEAQHAVMTALMGSRASSGAGSVGESTLYTVVEDDKSINEAGELFVKINACCPRKQILAASPGFMWLMGPFTEEVKELIPLIVARHRKKFEEWVLEHVHEAIFGGSGGGEKKREYGKISLRRAADKQAGVERRALCRFEPQAGEDNLESDPDCFPLVIYFTMLENVRPKPKSSSKIKVKTSSGKSKKAEKRQGEPGVVRNGAGTSPLRSPEPLAIGASQRLLLTL
eukprot:TRINITY_DN25377_c0_g1_i1.p1 TRINITY_DN25377_c0_g1~~TRINITY_DN25377_c0_g1_i1.p1  ORF type:complete len:630 (+),score=126.72 TRINITY_DN25377_c0_g1_i1:110-1999(+)